jgi:hypothetical protein
MNRRTKDFACDFATYNTSMLEIPMKSDIEIEEPLLDLSWEHPEDE